MECDNDIFHQLECTDRIIRARQNALIMLKNRGFSIPSSLIHTKSSIIKDKYTNFINQKKNYDQLDILIPNKNCIAKIVWIKEKTDITKVIGTFSNQLASLKSAIYNGGDSQAIYDSNLIIILVKDILLKPEDYFINNKPIENDFISYFTIKYLQINLIEHNLIPTHQLMSIKEMKELRKHYQSKKADVILPKIIRFPSLDIAGETVSGDPVARYYGLKYGDIIKITRKSPTGGVYYSYREVRDISSNETPSIVDLLRKRNQEIPAEKSSANILEKLYFESISNNLSYSGYSLEDLTKCMKDYTLNKDKEQLKKVLKEISSFNLLKIFLESIVKKLKLGKILNTTDRQTVSRILSNKTKMPRKNKIQWVENKLTYFTSELENFLNTQILNLYNNFYLNSLLVIHIEKSLKLLKLGFTYSNLLQIISPLLGETIRPNIMNSFIYSIFALPPSEEQVINYKQFQKYIKTQLPTDNKITNLLKIISNKQKKVLTLKNYQKYHNSNYIGLVDIFELSNTNLKLKLLALFESLVEPVFIEEIPGCNLAFLYLLEIIKLTINVEDLEKDIIIQTIFKILITVIDLDTLPNNYLKDCVMISKKYFDSSYENRNFNFLYNIVLMVLYRKNDSIYRPISILDLSEPPFSSLNINKVVSIDMSLFSEEYRNPLFSLSIN